MSQEGQIPTNFAEWVIRSLDGTISAEEFAQLDPEIATNETARAYYWELITIHVGLVDLVGGLPRAEALVNMDRPHAENTAAVRVPPEGADQERIRELERRASRLLDGQLRFSGTLGVVPSQSEPIEVSIDPGNRFLTLVTTTPGEYRYCWALFAEPALELTRVKNATAGVGKR